MVDTVNKRWMERQSMTTFVYTAALVLLCGLVLTTITTITTLAAIKRERQTALTSVAISANDAIDRRLTTYIEVMRGGNGLFTVKDDVSRGDWRDFVAAYDLPHRYPGITTMGYASYVTAAQRDGYTAAQSADGVTDGTINPAGTRDDFVPITYREPTPTGVVKSLGFDLQTDSIRRDALWQARDSGEATLTGRLALSDGTTNQAGFSIYYPVYHAGAPAGSVAERQAALQGYIYSGFRSADLLNDLLKNNQQPGIGIEIYDGTIIADNSLIFKTASADAIRRTGGVIAYTRQMQLDHHVWTEIVYGAPANISLSRREQPWLILGLGIVASILLSGLLLYVMIARSNQLYYAKQAEVQAAKDELLSLASHQLRTPATGVKQYIGMLLEGYVGEITGPSRDMLTKAYEGNERQLEIINQILYVARADAGRLHLNKHEVDLPKLIESVIEEQYKVVANRQQTVKFQYGGKPLMTQVDEQYLRMTIENLLSNASKYSYEATTIQIALRQSHDKLRISVSDRGVGISKEDLPKLFQKFSRIENPLSTQAGGTGIGLYLCREIISLHGGEIRVDSTPGRGTTFTIELPRKSA